MHRLLKLEDDRPGQRPKLAATLFSYGIFGALIAVMVLVIDWSFVRTLDFGALWPYRVALLRGLGLTMMVSVAAVVIGLSIGIILAILLQAPIGKFRWLVMAYVEVARSTPLIVQLFWFHFALPYVTGISTSAVQSGFLAMGFQASGYLTDIARAGIQSVPHGQAEASYSLGLPVWTKWTKVILPQALKTVIPPLANVSISFFKTSAILSVLSVGELMSMGLRVADSNFKPIETLTFCGLVYVVLGTIFSRATHRLEHLTQEKAR